MIVETKASNGVHVRGVRVEKGTPLYAVQKGRWFFVYLYTDRAMAEDVDAKLIEPKLQGSKANWREKLDDQKMTISTRKL